MHQEEFESRFENFWREQPPSVVHMYDWMLLEVYRRASLPSPTVLALDGVPQLTGTMPHMTSQAT